MSDVGFSLADVMNTAKQPAQAPAYPTSPSESLFGSSSARQLAAQAKATQMVTGQAPAAASPLEQVLAAPDYVRSVTPLVGANPTHVGRAAAFLQQYADQLSDIPPEARLGAAQVDLAKAVHAHQNGLLDSPTMGKFLADPHSVDDAGVMDLIGHVRSVGDATDNIISPKLETDGSFKVAGIDLTPTGTQIRVALGAGPDEPKVKDALAGVQYGTLPYVAKGEGRQIVTTPSGAVVTGPVDRPTAESYRHLYPCLTRPDGNAIWAPGSGRQVLDAEAVRARLDHSLVGHQVEQWASGAWPDGHPATKGQTTIVLKSVDSPATLSDYGTVVDPGVPALVGGPTRNRGRLQAADLSADILTDTTLSPLKANDWVVLPAAAAGDARKAGFDPIPQSGEDGESVLVFGMSPAQGIRLATTHGASKVWAPDAVYHTTHGDKAVSGMAQPYDPDAVRFLPASAAPALRFTLHAPGGDVAWQPAYHPEETAHPSDPDGAWAARSIRRAKLVALTVPSTADVSATMKALDGAGEISHVYASGAVPQGWARAREHVYADEATTLVARTADPEFSSPHGFDVWVRETDSHGLPAENPDGHRVRKPQQVAQGNGVATVDGQVALRLPPGVEPQADPTKLTLNGKHPTHLVLSNARVPELAPVWSDTPPQGGTVLDVSGRTVTLKANPADLTPAIEAADALGALGFDHSRVRITVDGKPLRP